MGKIKADWNEVRNTEMKSLRYVRRLLFGQTAKPYQSIPHFTRSSPVPVAERSKVRVCGRSLAGVTGSNPAGGMYVCLLCVAEKMWHEDKGYKGTQSIKRTERKKKKHEKKSRRCHRCLFLVYVVCFQVEVSASPYFNLHTKPTFHY